MNVKSHYFCKRIKLVNFQSMFHPLRSSTSIPIWYEYMFISEDKFCFINRSCKVELDLILNSKMVSEFVIKFLNGSSTMNICLKFNILFSVLYGSLEWCVWVWELRWILRGHRLVWEEELVVNIYIWSWLSQWNNSLVVEAITTTMSGTQLVQRILSSKIPPRLEIGDYLEEVV
jgi:hypothetical protein